MSTEKKPKTVFASVGSRFPMDRLLNCLEKVVDKHPIIRVRAQTGPSACQSSALETVQNLSPDEFKTAVSECDVFVSHAGMGNVLLAAQLNKPIIVMPRQASFDEHINNHQVDTAQAFTDRPWVKVVNNTQELESAILSAMKSPKSEDPQSMQGKISRKKIISTLKAFIDND